MLSFQEFQEQILNIFDVTEKECKFARNCTYFGVTITYEQWIVFDIKYIKDYDRWHIEWMRQCNVIQFKSLVNGVICPLKLLIPSIFSVIW